MRKRELIKDLRVKYDVKIKRFGDFDFEIITSTKSFHVKVLNITVNHQITINSKLIWDIKRGKIKGIKFNTISSELLNLKEFNKLENKIVFLTNSPYKLLKALNESDLKDISNELIVNDIFITSNILELFNFLK